MDDRRTFGGIVGMALEVYGQQFGTFFAIALVGQFLSTLGRAFLSEVSWEEPILNNLALVAAGGVAFLIGLIPHAMQVPALLAAVNDTYRGEPTSLGRAFDRASTRLTWETAWVNLIAGWFAFGGLLLGIVPGILVWVWFCLADVAVVLEGKRDLNALKRSQRLVRGYGGKALALLLVGLLAAALPAGLVRMMVKGTMGGLLSGLMGIVATPFQYALLVLLYYDLKARKGEAAEEGFNRDGQDEEQGRVGSAERMESGEPEQGAQP